MKVKAIGLIFCLVLVAVTLAEVQVGPNIPVSTQFGDQTEPSIAVDPNDPNHLIAGAIDVPADGCRFFVSFDGGNTWSTGFIDNGTRQSCADPSVAFDSAGNTYFAGFFFDRQFTGGPKINTAIGVAKSVDGGNTYAAPRFIGTPFGVSVDKPYIAVDTTGGSRDGTIYVAYNTVSFSNPSFRSILIGISTDGGVNFVFRTVEGVGNNTFAHAAVGPDGEVYVSWRQFNPSEIRIAKSVDGGFIWFNKVRVAEIGDQDPAAGVQGTLRTTRYPITGVSPRGEVLVVFADDPPLHSILDTPLATSPDPQTIQTFGINNAGWTVGGFFGERENGFSGSNGFLHTPFTDKRIVVAVLGSTVAHDINNTNQIVGKFDDASGEHGFLLDGNGFSTTLGFLPATTIDFPGATSTRANGINNPGQIVGGYIDGTGTHGFLLDGGSFSTIDFPGATLTEAFGINDAGEIVGCYLDGTSLQHGFLRTGDNNFTTVDFPGAFETCAFGINNAGKIVGRFDASPGASTSGFLRDDNGVFTTIDVPSTAEITVLATRANAINDADEIVGFVVGTNNSTSVTGFHGFLAYVTPSQNIWLARSAGNRCEAGDNDTRTCSSDADCPNGTCVQGGSVWSSPARINDNTNGDQFDPWMYMTPAGRVHVSWLDRRNDPNNFLYETFYATSANGGLTFSPNERVATTASDPRGASLGGFIGDYMGLAGAGDTVFPAWPDMRDGIGDQNIYSARVECGLVDNGDGTITDTCTGVMWLQDANHAQTTGVDTDGQMNWADTINWADGLVVNGFTDWRLPTSMGFDPNCQAGATFLIAVNCIGSEMGYLLYVRGVSSATPGVFLNIQPRFYWSGTEFNPNRAWTSKMSTGEMGAGNKPSELFAWAVRDVKLTDTPIGLSATVFPHPDVSVTFTEVTAGGSTTVEVSTTNPGPDTFQFLGVFYDINTTATFTPPVTVCLRYQDSDIPAGTNEADLALQHLEGGTWVNITSSHDTVNNIICGTVSSLSWFGVAGPPANQPPVANAGPDQTVECASFAGSSVTLDGTSSSDPDGDPLSYEWKDAGNNVVGTNAQLNLTIPLGTHTFTLTVDDGRGGVASDTVQVIVQDTTPPDLTFTTDIVTVILPTATATDAVVDVLAESGAVAIDACDPSPGLAPSGSLAFSLGETIVTITATDASGNQSGKQLIVRVVYAFGSFLPPVRTDGSSLFKSGRTVPIKFFLTAGDGSFITNATATLAVFKTSDAVMGTVEEITPEASGSSNTDNLFRFDPTTNQYIYNLSLKGYSRGTYLLVVSLDDGSTHEMQVSAR